MHLVMYITWRRDCLMGGFSVQVVKRRKYVVVELELVKGSKGVLRNNKVVFSRNIDGDLGVK